MTGTTVAREEAGRFCIVGPCLIADAPGVFAAGLDYLRGGAGQERVYDFTRAAETDSSALAALFGWRREARARSIAMRVVSPTPGMRGLAALYGVTELLF